MWNKLFRIESVALSSAVFLVAAVFMLPLAAKAQGTNQQASNDDSNVRPPVTNADLQIAKRAREILDSPAKWNRADNRECPAGAKTFSLYCALQVATTELCGKAEHRGAALQEARFVIDEIALNRNYNHRLMDYNNDPTTTFNDIQEVLRLTENLIALRLKAEASNGGVVSVKPPPPTASSGNSTPVTKTDIEIVKRARQILDAPAKWDRHDTQACPADETVFSLYCALVKARTEVSGTSDAGDVVMQEARRIIDETAPNHEKYKARLTDFNNDLTVTFPDIQKLLQLVEERLTRRLAGAISK